VSDGKLAVAEYAQWKPHCICMDMRMPIMDGYEATRRIRRLPGGDVVKIVALTAAAFEDDRAAILEAGCDAVVRKPLQASTLFTVIGDLLGLKYRRVATV
jgi:CheY-like chemotaxis protein